MSPEKKGILFVDDDPNLLEGLRRMLREKREVWEMSFVESGSEALAVLDGSHFDVVVADYKMPGMNGFELLERVKVAYPHIKRVLLTGQYDEEIFERSGEIVRLHLSKPCAPEDLVEELENILYEDIP